MSALDPSVTDLLDEGQPKTTTTDSLEPIANEPTVDDGTPAEGVTSEPTVNTEPDKVHIEGFGDFTVEELKEFKNGYLRQSDLIGRSF